MRTRIAVLVSGGGTNLQALIDAQGRGEIPDGEIALVMEKKILEALASHDIGMIVLAGFMAILSKDFVSRWPERIINIHPSLIPSFCGEGFYGLHVHEAALNYGVKVTGATVHYVNEIPDGGRIICQKAVEIRDGDTPETLQRRVMEEAEWKLLPIATQIVAKRIRMERSTC